MLAAPAAAAERTVTVPSPGPGPARFDRVEVTKIGPSRAGTVLVLMPGFQGGAGDFLLVGRDLVRRVDGLQVWAVDRRSQPLEDTKVFDDARAGRVSVQQAFDYYLGWLADPTHPAALRGAARRRRSGSRATGACRRRARATCAASCAAHAARASA